MAKRKSRRSESISTSPLLEPLTALQHLLELFGNRGLIIGGVAASLLGQPRLTADLDAVIILSTLEISKLLIAADKAGIVARIPRAEDFARKNRVLLLRHVHSGINIDVTLGNLPFEVEMVERGQEVSIGEVHLRLPTPEDLIIMKAVAHRSKDLEDIKAIAASHPNLDKPRIQYWVEQFGAALELPNLWDAIIKLL